MHSTTNKKDIYWFRRSGNVGTSSRACFACADDTVWKRQWSMLALLSMPRASMSLQADYNLQPQLQPQDHVLLDIYRKTEAYRLRTISPCQKGLDWTRLTDLPREAQDINWFPLFVRSIISKKPTQKETKGRNTHNFILIKFTQGYLHHKWLINIIVTWTLILIFPFNWNFFPKNIKY